MTVETYEALEERIRNLLLDTYGSPEEVEKNVRQAEILLRALNEADKNSADYQDEEEKLKIEKEKIEKANQIEEEKLKVSWQRAALEIGKVTVPTLLSLFAYGKYQKRVMKYEETGKVCSTAGRELHLPNPFRIGK